MVTKYSQRELSERDYVNDNPTDVATERPKKKSNLLRNLAITGAIVGGLVYGGHKGLEALDNATKGFEKVGVNLFLNPVGLKLEDFNHE